MKQIGRYRIVSELGRGAMGVVYRAHDPKIDREIALKTIRLATHADPSEMEGMRDRLIREAQSAGRLSHPGIVTIFDAGEQDGLAYVAMELVEGRSLADILSGADVPAAKLDFLAALLTEAGSALDYASANGVIHRDVKPANIMVSDRRFKLLDFGVARIASGQATRAGTVFGTPNYMSPEQVQGRKVDGRADQFSLGVIAYEVLSGVKPFEAPSIPATLYKIVHEDPEPLSAYLPDIPEALERPVLRALGKSPDDRFDNCAEFAREFSHAAEGLTGLEPAISQARGPAQGDANRTFDGQQHPDAELSDPTISGVGWPSPDSQRLSDSGRKSPQPLPRLQTDAGVQRPGGGAEEPILPVREVPTKTVDPVAGPRPRWPSLIFALLILAIAALALLLVRYPGLLEDPRTLVDAILGTNSSPQNSSATTAPAPTAPSINDVNRAESQIEDEPESADSTLGYPSPVFDDPVDPEDAEQSDASSTPRDPPSSDEASPEPIAAPADSSRGESATADQTGAIFFQSPVEGVVVTLDGNRDWQCITPCRLRGLPLGERKLVARRDGYTELHRTLNVSTTELSVDLPMERVGAVLLVSSEPEGARIILNGRDTGLTTNARLTVSPGKHSVQIVLGRFASERSIEVAKDETRYVQFRLGTQ